MNFFLFLYLLNFAMAEQKVLLTSQNAEKVEYRVFLNLNKDFISFNKYFKKRYSENDNKIINEYKNAKIKWSQAQLIEAKNHFKNVINLSITSHPSHDLQKLIFDAHIRYYQLQSQKTDQVLKDALGYFTPHAADLKIYGPYIKEKILKFKNATTRQTPLVESQNTLKPKKSIDQYKKEVLFFDTVLINNQQLKVHEIFHHSLFKDTTYHFTFTNDSGFVKSFTSTPTNFFERFLNSKTTSWSIDNKHSKNVYIFKNQEAQTLSSFNIKDLKPDKNYYVTEIQNKILQPQNTRRSEIKLYKNKWFWVGVSAIATAVYLQSNKQEKSSKQPPTIKDGL